MRRALIIAGASVLLTGLVACSGEAEAPSTAAQTTPAASPSMWTPDPTEPPPAGPSDEAEPSSATLAPASPTAAPTSLAPTEEAPSPSGSPLAQPSAQGGPWTTVGLTATTPEEVSAATELPQSFRDFLVPRIGSEDDFGCTTTEVVVKAVHADGFVFGSEESDCGGGQVVWGITEGQWNYIVQFGDAMPCRDFELNDIPPGVPGLRCLDEQNNAKDY